MKICSTNNHGHGGLNKYDNFVVREQKTVKSYKLMFLIAPFFQKTLHSAWKEISRLRDNVSTKRSRLQLQKQKLKLFAILRGQASDMLYCCLNCLCGLH